MAPVKGALSSGGPAAIPLHCVTSYCAVMPSSESISMARGMGCTCLCQAGLTSGWGLGDLIQPSSCEWERWVFPIEIRVKGAWSLSNKTVQNATAPRSRQQRKHLPSGSGHLETCPGLPSKVAKGPSGSAPPLWLGRTETGPHCAGEQFFYECLQEPMSVSSLPETTTAAPRINRHVFLYVPCVPRAVSRSCQGRDRACEGEKVRFPAAEKVAWLWGESGESAEQLWLPA